MQRKGSGCVFAKSSLPKGGSRSQRRLLASKKHTVDKRLKTFDFSALACNLLKTKVGLVDKRLSLSLCAN